MTRTKGRTQTCSTTDARARRQRATTFLSAARLIADEDPIDADYASAAAALTVLAGIAAADAACCAALGLRSRGDSHHDAETLLAQITPGGKEAATALRRLVNEKDEAHYGFRPVSGATLTALLRRADQLIEFADAVARR